MSMETKHGPGHEPHGRPHQGYEHTDASAGSLSKWALALFIVIVVVFVAMRWLFFFYGKVQSLGRPASPFENVRVLPPQPRLQTDPRADLHGYCVQQLSTLNSYGWADQHNGVVHIPIDRAMELALQQGLPARAAGEVPPGVSNPAPFVPNVTDAQGPCGFVTARDADREMSQEVKR